MIAIELFRKHKSINNYYKDDDDMNNEQIIFNKVPDGMPQDDTFKYEDIDVIEPSENELQLKTLYISVDPYMRDV